MSLKLIRRILAEASGRGLREIIPSTMGEPLLWDGMDALVDALAVNALLMALRKEPERRYASVQEFADDRLMEVTLIENIQREDLNPIEEAEAYRYLMSSFDLSQDEVARRVGKDRSTVAIAPSSTLTTFNTSNFSFSIALR